MPKRKNLNGIPHNITKSFFGTERYYNGGYMGDWLLNAAKQLHLTEASLDVMQAFHNTRFYCFPYLVDIDGKIYEGGRIMEVGLELGFDPFEESISI